jgi:ubiquinone/menaquinone biosynthesis C-methylase UbiE
MVANETAARGDVVQRHYRNLAEKYDFFLSYSPEFVRHMTGRMIEKLQLEADDRFVDLGGGTGIYSADILEQVPLRHPILLVDPFEEMLARAPDDPRLCRVHADALGFAARQGTYDKVLMKEAVHHVSDRARLFEDLFARLAPGGRLLLVHIPPRIDYPLFRAALERSLCWHADPDALAALLEEAGFAVERDVFEHRHLLTRETYFGMVRGRYMSLLSSFTDEEVEAGLAEMADTYAGRDLLVFSDRFDFITGVKAA